MGTRFELLLGPGEAVRLHAIGEEALGEIARLDRQLSVYRPSSDVSWINARASQTAVTVEPPLFALLERCQALSRATEARSTSPSDPSCGRGASSTAQAVFPTAQRAGVPNHVSAGDLHLDPVASTVRFGRPDMRIDLGAAGKGYAVDAAIDILRSHGITSALLHGGTSSVHALGAPLDDSAWHLAWKPPAGVQRTFDLRDRALSVSAVHGKVFEAQGRVYGHVMDPRAGAPTTAARAVAVVGSTSLECDALSTALLVLGAEWLAKFGSPLPAFRGGRRLSRPACLMRDILIFSDRCTRRPQRIGWPYDCRSAAKG
jgi:thiamine biosynthesis lipoprotein